MIERLRKLIQASRWKLAKSMPNIPHEYTLKAEWINKGDFEYFVQYIRDFGYQRIFYGRIYTYFDIDGYSYWTMGSPIDQTILINRAVKK